MRLDPRVKTQDDLSGWVLVESSLGRHARHCSSSLLVQRQSSPDEAEEILLPIPPDGRIHELITLPDDVAGLVWQPPKNGQFNQSQLTIRRVGWLERTWGMANRVLRNWVRLSADERLTSGLSLWRAVVDLPRAYRIATQFRGHLPYADWIERFDVLQDRDWRWIRAHIARFAGHPHFHLLLVVDDGGQEAVQATLASLREQLYRNFTCVVLDVAGAVDGTFDPDAAMRDAGRDSRVVAQDAVADWLNGFNASLADHHAGAWVMLVRAGDVLPAHALYWFACEVLARPEAAIVYSDDDTLDAEGRRCDPRFKPDWSLAHLRSTHYIGDAAILRGGAVAAAGGVSLDCCRHGNYDLLLRVVDVVGDDGAGKIVHVPAVLVHRAHPHPNPPPSRGRGKTRGAAMFACAIANPPPSRGRGKTPSPRAGEGWDGGAASSGMEYESSWNMDALRRHLARNGVAAEVSATRAGCWRVGYRLPQTPPLVSIIVPTRDALPLIRQCIERLLEKTIYPRFEILVVDNQSADPQALAYLAKIAGYSAVRVLRYDRQFNYSAINNFAVRKARGEVLCFLNNDTEVIAPDWLEELVGNLLQARVGVAGAKLYYPDGRVQHAGDTVGPGGCANHLHSLIGRDDPGYCSRAVVAQELSAVTAACLVTWRELYLRLGGLDEKHLKVAFNDVDYCLRVREAGYRVVWTPHAELFHHESVTRGVDDSWRRRFRAWHEVAIMRRRWGHVMKRDPFYNPNLSYQQPDFSLSRAPRVKKPWLPD